MKQKHGSLKRSIKLTNLFLEVDKKNGQKKLKLKEKTQITITRKDKDIPTDPTDVQRIML